MENRWPFRLHATYDESITRFLNVFEEVNKEIPLMVYDGGLTMQKQSQIVVWNVLRL